MEKRSALFLWLALGAMGWAQTDAKSQTPEQRAAELVSRLTLEEKVSQMQNTAPAIPRLHISAYDWWNEALHGVARAGLATVFPQAIGLAATWDTDLEQRIADVISTEARAKYNDALRHDNHRRYYGLTFWSPNINIFRDPRWGRGQETYGEDPYLTAQMALAFIHGMQGNDPHFFKTIATSKHFAVHSGPEESRHHFDARVSEQDLNDTYLSAFHATLSKGGAYSVMCAYNRLDGAPACASDFLLADTLRNRWKFPGYVVSDCGAIADIYRGHHYAGSMAEAAAKAVKAGTDLACGREYNTLVDAVHKGYIREDEIDRSVKRLFTARFRLGMFDPPERVPFSRLGIDQVASVEHQQLALEAAETGHLILSTLTTMTAPKAVERILGAFSAMEQDNAKERLARMLRLIVCQRLIPCADGERTAIFELVDGDSAELGLHPESRTHRSTRKNSVQIDAQLERLVRSGNLAQDVALSHAVDRASLSSKLSTTTKPRLR